MTCNPEFATGLTVLPLLCFSSMLFGLYYFRSMGLLFEKKTHILSIIIIIASIVSLSSNLVLVPLFSYHGAAMASSLAYLIMFIVCSILSQRYYPIKIDRLLEVSGISLAGLLCLLSLFLGDRITPLKFGLIALLCGVIYACIVGWIFRDKISTILRSINSKRNPPSNPAPTPADL